MIIKKELKLVCVGCGEVFAPDLDTDDSHVECPHCGINIDSSIYNKLYLYSEMAVRYGHDYKVYYESQKNKNNDFVVKPCLNEPSIFENLVSQAVISGIIGGASYDMVKKVISKIVDKYCSVEESTKLKQRTRVEPTLGNIDVNDIVEQELAKNIMGFHDGLSNMSPELKAEVEEEMIADSFSDPEYTGVQLNRFKKLTSQNNLNTKPNRRARRLAERTGKKVRKTAHNRIEKYRPKDLGVKKIWRNGE